jgi:hypothetical protein
VIFALADSILPLRYGIFDFSGYSFDGAPMFRNATVRASNEAELELGFRTADTIIVEGDSALREQAQCWAKHGAPDSFVEEAGGPAIVSDEHSASPMGAPRAPGFYVWVWLLLGVLVFVGGVSGTLYRIVYLSQSRSAVRGAPPIAAEGHEGSVISVITLLVWPAVALIALCMMFFLAKQALTAGSNVRFEWRVTEKVSGKLVITKVRSASGR